jgi:hypothetical protein
MSQQEVSTEVQEIWALFREIAKRQEETGIQIEKVAKRQEEANIQIEKVAKRQKETGIQIKRVAKRQEETNIQIERVAKRQEEANIQIEKVAKRQEEAGIQIEKVAKRQEEAGIQIEKVAKRQEEAGIQIKEVAKQQEGNDSKFKDLRELFTGQWGKLVEALVEPSVLRLFQERGIQVIDTAQRLKTKRNGEQMEIDILATNKDMFVRCTHPDDSETQILSGRAQGTKHSVIVVEVKTTLKVEDVNDFIIEKLSRFFEFFPKYKGMTLYGAVAGIRIEEESDKYADPSQYAQDKGLFVLTLSGEGMVVILSPE